MHVLLGKKDGQAFFLELQDGIGHLLHDHGRNPLGGLVEQHEQGVAHQRAGDREHLLLASAHFAAATAAHFSKVRK